MSLLDACYLLLILELNEWRENRETHKFVVKTNEEGFSSRSRHEGRKEKKEGKKERKKGVHGKTQVS